MVHIIKSKKQFIDLRTNLTNEKIGFVPTMGNLHKGHLSLINIASKKSDIIIISIFVNPTQFGEKGDFESYPRTIDEDLEKIRQLKLEIPIFIFAPSDISEVYPPLFATRFSLPKLDKNLCGSSRPGHFSGVLSVVYHLLNLVRPHYAVFGQKDYQQYLIIKSFCTDFFPAINVIMAPICREESGLAMSSRNSLLSKSEKVNATILSSTLGQIETDISKNKFIKISIYKKAHENISWDYLEVLDAENLQEANSMTKKIIIAGALTINSKVRIIDNIIMEKPNV